MSELKEIRAEDHYLSKEQMKEIDDIELPIIDICDALTYYSMAVRPLSKRNDSQQAPKFVEGTNESE